MNRCKKYLPLLAVCTWLTAPSGHSQAAPKTRTPPQQKAQRRAKAPPKRLTAAQQKAAFYRKFLALRRRALSPKGGLITTYKLVSTADVRRALKYKKPLEALFLQGIPRSKKYDAIQFVPKQGHFLMAIQMWHDPGKKGTTSRKHVWRWRDHLKTYPNARLMGGRLIGKTQPGLQSSPVGRVSLFAHRGRLYYLQFAASTRPVIISITCHQSACSHRGPMLTLAKQIDARLRHKGP